MMPEKTSRAETEPAAGGWLRFLLPRLGSFRTQFCCAAVAMALDALLTVLRPWPLKVVIDRVIPAEPLSSRVPLLGGWLDHTSLDPLLILCGA